MAKCHGKIGYGETMETPPGSGVWVDVIVEHWFYGDVIRNSRQLREGETLNQDLIVGNSISTVASAYLREHFTTIRYVEWMGELWTVQDVEVQLPRLTLRLGEVYNGPTAAAP